MTDDRITRLEEALAHQAKLTDDLSAIVADQAERIALLERRVQALRRRAAEADATKDGGAYFADERPPHY
ncbi:putative coiled-coil protein SlyX [Rubricella aquisinus]|uniref:Putative coiled-coil protein SlyX n=1 Tax=Rubricella aquisinus TaxID=2028108 RepID=A0A840WT23_9RHOB|nr:SlyX family protein [Rubricella aquisinus]MBB5516822.1 putative coiled-coil protein SlyX [Rubricella aquisinus]